jgi:hypothetical protein
MSALDSTHPMEELVGSLVQEAKSMLDDGKLEVSEFLRVLPLVMVLVEQSFKGSGEQKKSLVLLVFKEIIDVADLEEATKSKLQVACDTVLPPVIDTIIAATNGEYDINVPPSVESCMAFCCPSFF